MEFPKNYRNFTVTRRGTRASEGNFFESLMEAINIAHFAR
jgi:hypothetical protein